MSDASGGVARKLFYVPRTGTTRLTDPVRNSRSTGALVCEAGTATLSGDYYSAALNNPAVTGVDNLPAVAMISVDDTP